MLYLFRGAVVSLSKIPKAQQNTVAPGTHLAQCETMTVDTERSFSSHKTQVKASQPNS